MPREGGFRRNERLEELLDLLAGPVAAAGARLHTDLPPTRRPIVFVCACGRAGATLLMQLLATSGSFGYPSNLISRFHAAPAFGALVQRMLLDPGHQFRDELGLAADVASYRSDLGKTVGALSPNEFYYFWRRWFGEVDGCPPTSADVDDADFDSLRDELSDLAAVFARPLAFKGSLMNWSLPVLLREVPDAVVVFLRRDRLFNAQSLLEARLRHGGSAEAWYSFRPPNAGELFDAPPPTQVARQVVSTERAIAAGLADVDPARVVDATYEELCDRPAAVWDRIATSIATHPYGTDIGACPHPAPFESGNVRRLPDAELAAIDAALRDTAAT